MTRLPPVKHEVGGHYRAGKYIGDYKRGSRKKPRDSPKRLTGKPVGSSYNVTFSFTGGGSESYNTGGTATGALKAALGLLQRAEIPKSATLRRIKQ